MANSNLLGLDVGSKRVGVAIATADVSFARPLTTLDHESDGFWQELAQLVEQYQISAFVVGLPRGLDGQETGQTQAVRVFAKELSTHVDLPQHWQDEALTSVKAEETLNARGGMYQKGDIDSLAASYILEDYLQEKGVHHG